MKDKKEVDEAIRLYNEGLAVLDVMKKTGVTRTRLYNNLRKRGIEPNRQTSLVKADAKREADLWKALYESASQELGKVKFCLAEAEMANGILRTELLKLEAKF